MHLQVPESVARGARFSISERALFEARSAVSVDAQAIQLIVI